MQLRHTIVRLERLVKRNSIIFANNRKFFSTDNAGITSNLTNIENPEILPSDNLETSATDNLERYEELLRNLVNEKQEFVGYNLNNDDIGNCTGAFEPSIIEDINGFLSNLATVSPMNIYGTADEFSRYLTLLLANDYSLGITGGIIAVSVIVKFIVAPFMFVSQTQALRMKLIAPEMKLFQNDMTNAQKSGDYAQLNSIRQNMTNFQAKHGIQTSKSLVGLFQAPFLITWFLSVRHMAMSPNLFPEMSHVNFLWLTDLTVHDPYFLLPLISACCSSLNISVTNFRL